jgi:hypothetical protein
MVTDRSVTSRYPVWRRLHAGSARRVRNLRTRERAHLADETVGRALAVFEAPTDDERPVVDNAAMDLDQWVAEHIRP